MDCCWNCLFYCCRSSKKPKKKLPSKLKFDLVCNICGIASDDLIRECKTIAYHDECITEILESKPVVEFHCTKSSCPKYIQDVGHSVRLDAELQSQFKGRFREISTQLLWYALCSCCIYFMLGGNRPDSESSWYNWVPPTIIKGLFILNGTHLIAVGWQSFWLDFFTVLSLVLVAALSYYGTFPHIYEFIFGATVTAGLCIWAYFWWRMSEWCYGCSRKCCLSCRGSLFRKTYRKKYN